MNWKSFVTTDIDGHKRWSIFTGYGERLQAKCEPAESVPPCEKQSFRFQQRSCQQAVSLRCNIPGDQREVLQQISTDRMNKEQEQWSQDRLWASGPVLCIFTGRKIGWVLMRSGYGLRPATTSCNHEKRLMNDNRYQCPQKGHQWSDDTRTRATTRNAASQHRK